MRKFANFKLHQQNLEQIQEIPENNSPDRVILTEELVCMAISVVEFSREGYKVRKVFG